MDLRNDILKDRSVRLEQPEPSERIAAVGRASTLLVNSGRDHHHRRTRQIGIVAVAHRNRRRQDRAVSDVRHDAPGRLRSRLTNTTSRALPRVTNDNRHAEPTAPAPMIPTFISVPLVRITVQP